MLDFCTTTVISDILRTCKKTAWVQCNKMQLPILRSPEAFTGFWIAAHQSDSAFTGLVNQHVVIKGLYGNTRIHIPMACKVRQVLNWTVLGQKG